MKTRKCFGSPIAACLAVLMMLPFENPLSASAQQTPAASQSTQEGTETNQQPATASSAGGEAATPNYPDAPSPSSSQSSERPATSDQQNGQAKPLGTAAAPYTKPTGVMGSRPAGAVIAPAKQRRVHAILISVGILAAAGIAVGTVAALSKGSPSRP